ncbi:MAG: efflux RND transporter permease subunit, partial [Phycisphaerae bacterium]
VMRQIEQRINAIRNLPEDTEPPVVTEFVVRDLVLNIGIYGEASERSIRNAAMKLRRKLLQHTAISQVSIAGLNNLEVSIELSQQALDKFGLKASHIVDAIHRASFDLPAGTMEVAGEEINVRTVGQRYSARQFGDIPLITRQDGAMVRLNQVADIQDRLEHNGVVSRVNGQPGLVIKVFKTKGEDINVVAAAARAVMAEQKAKLPATMHLATWADASQEVTARLHMLAENAAIGMVLVVLSLLIFVNRQSAMAVALGIPVALAGALAALGLTGGSLNMISLLGLLMATGIIVDDAIVIADSVRKYAQQGMPPLKAAVKGTGEVALPVLASSATTIIAFVPLMLVDGVMGKMIFVLPVVVIAVVIASCVEAFLILPAHLDAWSGNKSGRDNSYQSSLRQRLDRIIDNFIVKTYEPTLNACLANRGVVLAAALSIFLVCTGAIWGNHVPIVMFPSRDANIIRARVQFPDGTPLAVTGAAVAQMEAAAGAIRNDDSMELVRHVQAVVGEWSDYVPQKGHSLGEVIVELSPAESRRTDVRHAMEQWRDAIGSMPGAEALTIDAMTLGPTSKPIEVHLLGEDLDQLRAAAGELCTKLSAFKGVFGVETNLRTGKKEVQVIPKPDAGTLGVTVADLATQLRHRLHEKEAVRVRRGINEVKAIVRHDAQDRQNLGTLEQLRVRSAGGAEIPFEEVATTRTVRGYAKIVRKNGLRQVRVEADVDERHMNGRRITDELSASFLPELKARFPEITFTIDGQHQRIAESLSSLWNASLIAGLTMFALLGTVLRSYVQPIIVMAAIPLALVGAVAGHALLGHELSLMSIFGMTALAGIVVNDSLVLVDRIRRNLKDGTDVNRAVVEAGKSRFRAVIVTSLTTIAGLLPLLAERSAQAQSLIPIAISIAFGLAFATVLVLLVVPCLYKVVNDGKRLIGGPV